MPRTAELVALTPIRAEAAADFEAMRLIRNAGREWYTRDTRHISADAQRAWASVVRRSGDTQRAYVYDVPGSGIVGFGLLRLTPRDGCWYATLGVAPEDQGKGYGQAIYRHLAGRVDADVYAEILRANLPSLLAAQRAGYELDGQDERTVTMVRRHEER